MYYVYLLLLKNKRLYTGVTGDLKRRLSEHERGKCKFAKRLLPVKLVHYEAYLIKEDAERREKYLKTTERKRFLRQQIKILFEKFID